jgi:hypothetical protein
MKKFFPALLFAAALSPAMAQSQLQISVTTSGSASTIAPGGSVAMTAADIGQPVLASVNVRYTGTSTASITGVSVTGTTEMSLLLAPTFPVTLNPNSSTSLTVQYLPSTGNAVTAQVSVAFLENGQALGFPFTVTGSAPRLSYSYFFAPGGTSADLNAGDRITFPGTNIGSSATAVVTVLNRGSAAALVQSIAVSGAAFALSGSQAPVQLTPGTQTSFNIVFSPQASGGNQGLLVIGTAASMVSFSLTGTGTSSSFTVSYTLPDGNAHPALSGVVIAYPATDINATATANIDILNQGSGAGTITGVSLAGNGFRLVNLPLLPATLGAGQTLRFGIVFAPTQPGTYSGSFSINLGGTILNGSVFASTSSTTFNVVYTMSDGVARPLVEGTSVAFPSVDVNATGTAVIDIVNQGPGAGQVTGVSLSGTGFRVTGVPVLPATIPSGQTLRFNIVFAPTQSGTFSATYRIDLTGRSIGGTLSGSTTTPNFSVSYTLADGVSHPIGDGSAIAFTPVDINGTSTAAIEVANQGTGAGTITALSVTGTGFRLTGAPTLPASVPAGQSARFSFVFAPTQTGSFQGNFRIDLTGRSIFGTLAGSTAPANMSLAYIDPDTNNVVALTDGGTLQLPKTSNGAVTTVTMMAVNSGAGTGQVTGIALGAGTQPEFQLVQLPSMPVSVAPSQQLRFGVRFSPKQQESFSGSVAVTTSSQTLTVNLRADGIGPQFTYTYGADASPVEAGGTLTLPDTAVGQTFSVPVIIVNNGTGDGQIAALNVSSGQGLSVTDVPALPFTISAGATRKITLNFTPTQPGPIDGRLNIGGDSFTVAGSGIGSRLIFTYSSGSSDVTVAENGTVIFAPIQVGKSGSLMFSVQNTGTSAATLTSIGLTAPGAVFALQQLPGLPMSLDAGSGVTFPVTFAPNNTGSLTATLRVNGSSFTLSGTGTQPAPLPSYDFKTNGSISQAAQQPTVGLALSAPYPVALQGTLKLSFVSSVFADDPAIQFATGGRTVNFTIPANSTAALFNGNATVPLQTGTTAGTIVITPSFAMAGGFDMTPTAPDTLSVTIGRSAPQVLSASIASQTLNSFSLLLSGFTTTRGLRQIDIQITPKNGETFTAARLTVDVSSSASAWFQGTASQAFGGSFLVTIPFNLQNGSSTDDLVHRLQSLAVTATNDVGTSNTVTVVIP